MMKMAILHGWRKDNPCLAVDNFKIKSKGHRTWTDDEITAYRDHYAIGTEQRLAFELLLNTGQRVSDVVKMGRKHVKDGCITITQKKSGETVEVTIPILPALKAVLDELQARRITPTFLVNQYGNARTEGGLSTMFIEWRNRAGLADDLHAHGLRKAFCRVAAEAGLTPHEIMSLSGHKTLHEVMRYTAAVDRKKLAASGMKKIEART
jgi:integrase